MIYLITPLSIPGYGNGLNEKIEPFREAVRKIVRELKDERLLLIEGPELVPKQLRYFPDVGIHPGDLGFAEIAASLAERMAVPPPD